MRISYTLKKCMFASLCYPSCKSCHELWSLILVFSICKNRRKAIAYDTNAQFYKMLNFVLTGYAKEGRDRK
jgi:hypothetical protein